MYYTAIRAPFKFVEFSVMRRAIKVQFSTCRFPDGINRNNNSDNFIIRRRKVIDILSDKYRVLNICQDYGRKRKTADPCIFETFRDANDVKFVSVLKNHWIDSVM